MNREYKLLPLAKTRQCAKMIMKRTPKVGFILMDTNPIFSSINQHQCSQSLKTHWKKLAFSILMTRKTWRTFSTKETLFWLRKYEIEIAIRWWYFIITVRNWIACWKLQDWKKPMVRRAEKKDKLPGFAQWRMPLLLKGFRYPYYQTWTNNQVAYYFDPSASMKNFQVINQENFRQCCNQRLPSRREVLVRQYLCQVHAEQHWYSSFFLGKCLNLT